MVKNLKEIQGLCHSLAVIFLLAVTSLNSFAQERAGPRDGGGGSYVQLLRYAGLPYVAFTNPAVKVYDIWRYHRDFVYHARQGVKRLEKLVQQGATYTDRAGRTVSFTQADLEALQKSLESVSDRGYVYDGRFLVKFGLEDKRASHGVSTNMAENHEEGGVIALNPIQWEYVAKTFRPEVAKEVYSAVAIHELLSLPPLKKERTNYYPVTARLIESVTSEMSQGVRSIYLPEVLKELDQQVQKSAYSVVYRSLNPDFRRAGTGERIIMEKIEPTEDMLVMEEFMLGWDLYGTWPVSEIAVLPFDMVYRLHDLAANDLIEGTYNAATSIRQIKKALNNTIYGTLPPTERKIQSFLARTEDETGLSCSAWNREMNSQKLVEGIYHSTNREKRVWNLEVKCRTPSHWKKAIELEVPVDPSKPDSSVVRVKSNVDIDHAVMQEPRY
jgi:hypothetical protein